MNAKEKNEGKPLSDLIKTSGQTPDTRSREAVSNEFEEILTQIEREYRILFDYGAHGLAVIDAGTLQILLCDQRAAEIYGFESAEDAIGARIVDFIHPDDLERALKHIADGLFEKDARQVNEFRTLTKGGAEKWIEAVGIKIEYNGRMAGLASFRDITERKLIKDALQESEERLRLTFESIKEGITITDLDGNVVMTNEAGLRMSGYSRKEALIGRSGLDFIAEKDRARAVEDLTNQVIRKVGSISASYTLIDKDGNEYEAEISASVLPDINGTPVGFISVVRDITERKLTEEALRSSEEKLRFMFESIADGIVVTNLEGKIIDENEACVRLFGYESKEAFVGINGLEFVSPKDRELAKASLMRALLQNQGDTMEFTLIGKDSREFQSEITTALLRDRRGDPSGFICVIRDITERKSMEKALRDSEEKYKDLVEQEKDVIFSVDTSGHFTSINFAVSAWGFKPEQLIGRHFSEFITPEWQDVVPEALDQILSANQITAELVVYDAEGKAHPIEFSATVIKDGDEYKGVRGIVRDVTKRKQIEEALRESEEKLRLTFESINEAIILTDMDGYLVDINEAGLKMSGYGLREEIIGRNGLEFFAEEDRESVACEMDRLVEEGRSAILNYKVIVKDGVVYDVEASAAVLRDSNGKPAGIIVVMRDVTERKQIEEALRESEEKLRLIFESIEDGIVVIDFEGHIVDVNEASMRLGGYTSKKQLIGRNAFDLIASKDLSLVMQDLESRLKGNPRARMEYLISPSDGRSFEVELTASTLRDQAGNPTGYIAVLRDVTDRKQAEMKLRESEEKYKELVESEKDVIFSIDASGVITSVNSAVKSWGYEPEDIIGRPYSCFAPAKMLETLETELPEQLLTRGEVVAEALGLDNTGQWRPIEFSATVIKRGDDFAGVRGIVRDITERKLAEEALKQRNRELATLNRIAETLSHSSGINKVLRTALDSVMETMNFISGGIWLIDGESPELKLYIYRGAKDWKISVEQMRKAVKEIDVSISEFVPDDPAAATDVGRADPVNKAKFTIAVPLKSRDKTLGILGVVTSNQIFTPDEIRLLETIGDQIAVAIENARLLEKLNELSITDELTGLFNRRHFYEVIENEINRTRRYGRCISLAMIDLDGFKKYNDKFGHASGDAILSDFAKALKGALRRTDSAFRYGGDEFIVILPATNAEKAKEVIDRIGKSWLKQLKGQYPDAGSLLGFSAGIAQFPDNAETVDGLVFLTDTALYYAKRGGKRRVMLISDLSASPLDALSAATLDQVYALVATVDTRDPNTYGHSKRVAALAESIGKTIGLKNDELSELVAAAFLHDIGKVGVADVILTKPGKPEKEEWVAIRKHCAEGAKIVSHVKGLSPLAPVILYHHEWWNGSGYPEGLKGKDIPLSSRIISVADAYDTMTAQRPYSDAIPQEEALEELERCSGTQFDPKLVKALRSIIKNDSKAD